MGSMGSGAGGVDGVDGSGCGSEAAAGSDGGAGGGWSPFVLGLSKRALLREVLPDLTACQGLQRDTHALHEAFLALDAGAAS